MTSPALPVHRRAAQSLRRRVHLDRSSFRLACAWTYVDRPDVDPDAEQAGAEQDQQDDDRDKAERRSDRGRAGHDLAHQLYRPVPLADRSATFQRWGFGAAELRACRGGWFPGVDVPPTAHRLLVTVVPWKRSMITAYRHRVASLAHGFGNSTVGVGSALRPTVERAPGVR
ncbi:hypothetical protein [Amycolatopsis sp. CA-230715]|uniref:hypothetical protein n=1 Tax=Amycolatopsis sp. CA-230715 TaxID=2745196 RepID=UPI001C02A661|nr:hypothetical protein [Amycolatopsis sp. CA-230715]